MSEIFVDNIKHQSSQGSGTITLGASGEKIDLGSGVTGTLTNGPAFKVHRDVVQSIAANTTTKVEWDTTVYDTGSCWDGTNYRFTPNVAGYYHFTTNYYLSNSSQECIMMFYKNGTEVARMFDFKMTNLWMWNGSCTVYMNGTTDYIETYVNVQVTGENFQGSGSTEAFNWFQGHRLII